MEECKTIRIASFDIGKKNFAQYVEDTDVSQLKILEKEYKSLHSSKKKRSKNVATSPEVFDILNKLYLAGTRVQTGVYDLRSSPSIKYLDIQTRRNILNHLEKFRKEWKDVDVVIVEQQFFKTWGGRGKNKGSEANVDAIKVGELVIGWFLSEYPDKIVEYFSSQNKTKLLGADKIMSKPQRKKWAEVKAREIYNLRSDIEMIDLFVLQDTIFRKRLKAADKIQEYIDTYPHSQDVYCMELAEKIVRSRQKLDDIADTLLQCKAYLFKRFIAT